jgi:hypothetical protein
MSSVTLESHVVSVLRGLSPHFDMAEPLIEAVEAGIDDESLAELAEVLSRAAASVDSEVRKESLEFAARFVAEERLLESADHEKESASASANIESVF